MIGANITFTNNENKCEISVEAFHTEVPEEEIDFVSQNVAFCIISPLGVVIYESDVDSPTFVTKWNVVSDTNSYTKVLGPIPKNQNLKVIEGTYTLQMKTKNANDNDGQTLVEVDVDYIYCPGANGNEKIKPKIEHVMDCANGILTIKDTTDYGNYEPTDYRLSITPPTNVPQPEEENYTTAKQLSRQIKYSGLLYTAKIAGTFTSTQVFESITVISDYTVSCIEIIPIDCSISLGNLMPCIEKQLLSIQEKACSVGGLKELPKALRDRYDLIMAELTLYNTAISTRTRSLVPGIIDRLEKLLDPDCDCLTKNQITPIDPACDNFQFQDQTVTQTPWIDIPQSSWDEDISLSGDSGFLRYRRTALNELQVEGQFLINPNEVTNFIVRDFFSGEFAPSRASVQQLVATQSVVNQVGGIQLFDSNDDGSYSLAIIRNGLSNEGFMNVNVKFPLD